MLRKTTESALPWSGAIANINKHVYDAHVWLLCFIWISWYLLQCRNGMVHTLRVSRHGLYFYESFCMSITCAVRHLIVRSIGFVVDEGTEAHVHASYRDCKVKFSYSLTCHSMLCCIQNSVFLPLSCWTGMQDSSWIIYFLLANVHFSEFIVFLFSWLQGGGCEHMHLCTCYLVFMSCVRRHYLVCVAQARNIVDS